MHSFCFCLSFFSMCVSLFLSLSLLVPLWQCSSGCGVWEHSALPPCVTVGLGSHPLGLIARCNMSVLPRLKLGCYLLCSVFLQCLQQSESVLNKSGLWLPAHLAFGIYREVGTSWHAVEILNPTLLCPC